MITESKKRYKDKVSKLQIDLFPTDNDIIEWLKINKPVATYIKKLIRNDIKKEHEDKCSEQ